MDSKSNMEKIIKNIVVETMKESGYSLERIILFGSRARGNFDENSDWDLLIVIKEDLTREEKLNLFSKISKKLAKRLIPCDLLIRSRKEVEKLKTYFHSVTKTKFGRTHNLSLLKELCARKGGDKLDKRIKTKELRIPKVVYSAKH